MKNVLRFFTVVVAIVMLPISFPIAVICATVQTVGTLLKNGGR